MLCINTTINSAPMNMLLLPLLLLSLLSSSTSAVSDPPPRRLRSQVSPVHVPSDGSELEGEIDSVLNGVMRMTASNGGFEALEWEAQFLRDNIDPQEVATSTSSSSRHLELQAGKKTLRFAVLGSNSVGPFQLMAHRGCVQGAARLLESDAIEATCDLYGASSNTDIKEFLGVQKYYLSQIIQAAVNSKGDSSSEEATANQNSMFYDGIMVSATVPAVIGPMLDEAVEAGIAVVTYETDAPDSKRAAFAGTNNTFMGIQLGRVLKQLRPEGGSFAALWAPVGESFVERTEGFRFELLNNSDPDVAWVEVPNSPAPVTKIKDAMEGLNGWANNTDNPPTAIAILINPLFDAPQYETIVDRYRHLNITWIGVGDSERQMDLMARNYVHGLLGHLPFDMGLTCVENMMNVIKGRPIQQEFKPTNVVSHIQIPVLLPELVMDHNRVGQLAIIGYIFFAFTGLTSLFMGSWVWFFRNTRVVKASQPTFLLMVAIGVFIMSSGMVPLGLDDSHGDSEAHRVAICMSPLWLVCIGFSVAFAALFSKTRRVNQIFKAGSAITRIKIKTHHVMLQCLGLLAANVLVLSLWTALDPLTYTRADDPGTDGWNRVLSTSGTCQSNQLAPYLVPLVLINSVCIGIANWQAYEARFIQSEFSEAKYIGITCVSMMQTGLIGIPILIVAHDHPEALYLVIVCMIFVVSMAILLFIFVPKMVLMDNYARHSTRTQGRMIQKVIREQAQQSGALSKKRSQEPSGASNVSGLETVTEPDTSGCKEQEVCAARRLAVFESMPQIASVNSVCPVMEQNPAA
ncbi:acid type B receptor subunit 2 [Seminavis robusta]|uniref:Acid type B receptor subunit 2 n=1 Tax=Seminavis robusta TaxID=568900 RepID=A0A9N8H8B2_9STRA|nr:acid type B receptor subunit 2 [Seminavis robusta]|eukprot:Sro164_g073460.1 acid type B receptor subunit 2 (801) ;mRNA; f:7946-10425